MIWTRQFTLDELQARTKETMCEVLGIEFTEIKDSSLVAKMPVDSRTVQPARILHGGASVALAETLGSVASAMCIDAKKYLPVGIEINANHHRQATSGFVTGEATPLQ